MFYYISFLRPPPLRSPPYGTIAVTPQIANDLRTQLFSGKQDIFYSWSQSSSLHDRGFITTKPKKLTTWSQAIAYKEIPVPVPTGARTGQSWRLVLTAADNGSSDDYAIDLRDGVMVGKHPFPVISMPVLFGSQNQTKLDKQERIERMYKFSMVLSDQNSCGFLRVIEQTSFDLDKKIWDSGIGLSSWLLELRGCGLGINDDGIESLKDALFSPQQRNILELGAGTGIVSIILGALRSTISSQYLEGSPGRIITTDLPSAIPLLEHNISLNDDLFNLPGKGPEAAVLDWDQDLPDNIKCIQGAFDAIIMADVTYNTSSFPSLIRTFSRLVHLSSKPPVFLLGYKERDPAERSLWEMAHEIGIVFKKVGEREGFGADAGAPVEIWIGRFEVTGMWKA